MKRTIVGLAALALVPVSFLMAQDHKLHAASTAVIARGKYLVESTGMCQDCHTPRDEKGEFVKEQWLRGATLSFKPIFPMPVWAEKSVDLVGLPGWTKDAAIKFMMTGIAFNDLPARPPMPQYRYNRADAEAIVAYLKSLTPAK